MLVYLRYHLKDVIVGKIYFLLVRIKIQHMELQLIKKEITGIGIDLMWLCVEWKTTHSHTCELCFTQFFLNNMSA